MDACKEHVHVEIFFDSTIQVVPFVIVTSFAGSLSFFLCGMSASALKLYFFSFFSPMTCPTSLNKRQGQSASYKALNNLALR